MNLVCGGESKNRKGVINCIHKVSLSQIMNLCFNSSQRDLDAVCNVKTINVSSFDCFIFLRRDNVIGLKATKKLSTSELILNPTERKLKCDDLHQKTEREAKKIIQIIITTK